MQLQKQLGLNIGQANQLRAAFDRLGDARTIDDQIIALDQLISGLVTATGDTDSMTKAQFDFYSSLVQSKDALLQQKSVMDSSINSYSTANKLADAYSGTLGILAFA